ncbi:TNF receptor-associated factor 5, partial [Silurus asotus]
MAAEENECSSLQLCKQSIDPVRSWELDSFLANHTLSFVSPLDERYMCPACGGAILNPHQTGCGHIFCAKCLKMFIESNDLSTCPLDGMPIKSEEVFQDNCCKRELLNLEVYCSNTPGCTQKMPLCNLQSFLSLCMFLPQKHLTLCQYEALQCSNPGCTDILLRKSLPDHQRRLCQFRTEFCRHCTKPYPITQLPDHEKMLCPEAEVQCPYNCSQEVKRHKIKEHVDECPELETDCIYKQYGCKVRDKRSKVKIHEYTEFSHHVLLVLESNSKIAKQVRPKECRPVVLSSEYWLENLKLGQYLSLYLNHQFKSESKLQCAAGKFWNKDGTRGYFIRMMMVVKQELQELRCVLDAELAKEELNALRASLDSLRQQVAMMQSLRDHLGALGQTCQRHTRLLDIHVEQLQCNEQRFRQLESTSYDGKLIWKVHDFQRKKDSGTSLTSPHFYTGRSGYKLSARVYPDGDGSARGTHLSLYIMVMRGDFDSLLPWPFHQSVTLTLLDQSGSRNHVSCSFTPDTNTESFCRPTADSNAALGFSRFISHNDLEGSQNAVFVRDDTLFIKVKVDTAGLDDL